MTTAKSNRLKMAVSAFLQTVDYPVPPGGLFIHPNATVTARAPLYRGGQSREAFIDEVQERLLQEHQPIRLINVRMETHEGEAFFLMVFDWAWPQDFVTARWILLAQGYYVKPVPAGNGNWEIRYPGVPGFEVVPASTILELATPKSTHAFAHLRGRLSEVKQERIEDMGSPQLLVGIQEGVLLASRCLAALHQRDPEMAQCLEQALLDYMTLADWLRQTGGAPLPEDRQASFALTSLVGMMENVMEACDSSD